MLLVLLVLFREHQTSIILQKLLIEIYYANNIISITMRTPGLYNFVETLDRNGFHEHELNIKYYVLFIHLFNFILFGSGTLHTNTIKLMLILGQVRLVKDQLFPAGLGKGLQQGPTFNNPFSLTATFYCEVHLIYLSIYLKGVQWVSGKSVSLLFLDRWFQSMFHSFGWIKIGHLPHSGQGQVIISS